MDRWLVCISVSLLVIIYIFLASNLRYRRVEKENDRLRTLYPDDASLARMTNEDAHDIIKYLQQYEFPFAFEVSLAASLYRPYGIPSIARVLAKTKQFADVHLASKRSADTAVLVVDFAQNPPESGKCCGAISRMNYIHRAYQKAGVIKDEDLLYTLALLAWLPVKFIERYEWRQLTLIELQAAGVFWKSLGDAMNLSYIGLASAPPDDGLTPRSAGGWRDGLHFLTELCEWSEQYEIENMRPHHLNHKAAAETEPILLYGIPEPLQNLGRQALSAVMDERLRRALMLNDPPKLVEKAVFGALQLRRFYLRYFSLPRFRPHLRVTQKADVNGRFHRTTWAAQPWYVKPSVSNRWRWQAWKEWLTGRPLPGDDGIKPEGYTHEEVGPAKFEGRGKEDFVQERERLMMMGRGGCPFG
ncbi:hypothetical protein LTR37_003711 [Vermiconidia calcicola]|uniref:Uncharacterized protein n=1 Tax=Vermiconidia calcicola TaxID=1690605 RepID=A0ACC3NPZ7_9PEZI|nr:hypothetical protein LTR37_003711 [Vermiconidia calcicola]